MHENIVTCILDGKPYRGTSLPKNAIFVGMEKYPNKEPRYKAMFHPWFNKPCYETPEFQNHLPTK